MDHDFPQIEWDAALEDDCRQLIRLAVREDLDRTWDWTTAYLVPSQARGGARIVARATGVISGLQAVQVALDEMQADVELTLTLRDGDGVEPGTVVAILSGSARDLLTTERIVLNLIGHLSGIATLTRQFVRRIDGTTARLYDTRKTTPGWRRLEKLAVRHGGGYNHRLGLYAAVMIKDNHLAWSERDRLSPAAAIARVRDGLLHHPPQSGSPPMILEVEVDTMEQLAAVLPENPDIVLLDNMLPSQLARCVDLRNQIAPHVELEASGGVRLDTVRAIAESGVERISVGALTHSAVALDVGLDWTTGS